MKKVYGTCKKAILNRNQKHLSTFLAHSNYYFFKFCILPTGGTTNGHHYDSEEYDEDIDFVPQNGYTDDMPPPVATGGKKEKPER